jgi:hypothetical protein
VLTRQFGVGEREFGDMPLQSRAGRDARRKE